MYHIIVILALLTTKYRQLTWPHPSCCVDVIHHRTTNGKKATHTSLQTIPKLKTHNKMLARL